MIEKTRFRTFSKPESIRKLLARATQKSLLLNIQIEAYTLKFHSRFSDQTDLSKDHLILEALFPSYGNELLSSNRFMTVSFSTGNFLIDFKVPFDKGWKEDGSWLWKIEFPEVATLRPSRRFYRVEPSVDSPVRVYFELDDDLVLGNVIDLSEGGLLFISKVRAPVLETGRLIKDIQLKLPGRTVRMDAKVVRITSVNCAIAITDISNADRHALREYTENRVAEIRRGFAI
ncbi:MAG: PilZ domain-containing protein [Candidatus Coatesbacteria bacterium]|nr:PilZ domain-containing protein [Candidatus Coatesbacteria bacterium]